MKKLLILLFSILLSFNSYGGLFDKTVCVETETVERGGLIYLPNKTKPFSGKNLCEYDSGQYKSQGKYKNGKRKDVWTEWEKNGQILTEEKYKDGNLIITTYFFYYKNGQKKSEENYIDGVEDGKFTIWHENGQKAEEGNAKDGKQEGWWTYWHENGQKAKDGNFTLEFNEISYAQFITSVKQGKVSSVKITGKQISGVNTRGEKFATYNPGDLGLMNDLLKNGVTVLAIKPTNKNSLFISSFDGKWTKWNENGQIESESNWKDGECISGDCPS